MPLSIINFTQQIIDEFIEKFKTINRKHYIVYTVHVLCHLPEDCARFRALDSFSIPISLKVSIIKLRQKKMSSPTVINLSAARWNFY